MLKHEDNSETPSRPAAQVRVTPQELTAALARLEARQGGLDGTIPLGDAVQELGLNTTPEELLREIEAGRARPQENHSQRTVPKTNRLGVGAVFGLALLLCSGMVAFLRSAPSPPVADSPAIISVSVPQAAPQRISLDPNLLVGDATGKLVTLSEVGDNQPVKCNYSDGSFRQYTPDSNGFSWTLIKHSGHIYVRGLMPRMSKQALQENGANVSTWNIEGYVVPVTLPLNDFQVMPEGGSNKEFHAVNIHLDKHAYEKWQP